MYWCAANTQTKMNKKRILLCLIVFICCFSIRSTFIELPLNSCDFIYGCNECTKATYDDTTPNNCNSICELDDHNFTIKHTPFQFTTMAFEHNWTKTLTQPNKPVADWLSSTLKNFTFISAAVHMYSCAKMVRA